MRSSCCSSSKTRSTPARFMPNSVVISWIRRRRSTSACEYRRVPLGERLGSIRPRASYMRSVCGCISASSAATEIMKTPRSCSTRAVTLVVVRRVATLCLSRRAQDPLARVAVHDLRELLDGLLLLRGELVRHLDHEPIVQVTAAGTGAERRRTLAAQALERAVLGAGRHAQALGAVQRRDLDLGAGERLGDGDRDLDLEVVALGLEDRRLAHVRDHVEVARRPAAQAGLALAGQPDARALLDAGRDVHPIALHLAQAALAAAGRAGLLDHRAGAAAARARTRDGEHALALRLDAAAVADRADLRRGSRPGAGAAARRARRVGRDGHRHLGALDRLLERQRDGRLQILAALGDRLGARGAPAAGVEDARQDVRERAEVRGAARRAARAAPAERIGAGEHAAAVVLLALLGIAQDVVGLGDLLEAVLGSGVLVRVRVILARELAVRLLDVVLRRLLVDAEGLVVVSRARHRYAATTTRAGRSTAPLIR